MESITWIEEPPALTFVDELGYIAKLIAPSEEEISEVYQRFAKEKDWDIRQIPGTENWIATKGERYVRTGGPLDGKTFD